MEQENIEKMEQSLNEDKASKLRVKITCIDVPNK